MNYKIPLLILFSISILVSMSYAGGGCGASFPSTIQGCYPVNIVNTNSVATPQGFQQLFNSLPFNTLVGNWIFYNGISGNTLPAWAENSQMVWVNLEANTIGAGASANGVYYFGMGTPVTNYYITGNNVGEAPELTSAYAKYDNGATVFNSLYQNFAGTSTPSGWTLTTSSQVTVNNGFTLVSGASAASMLTSATYTPSTNVILDIYGYFTAQTGSGYGGWGYVTAGFGQRFTWDWRGDTSNCNPQTCAMGDANGGSDNYFGTKIATASNYIYSYYWPGSTVSISDNYNAFVSQASGPTGALSIGVAWVPTGSVTTFGPYYWVRLRAYPPSDVMPLITYGSLMSPSGAPIVSITPTPASQIDLTESQTWTASVVGGQSPFTYNWEVWNSMGIVASAIYSGLGNANSFAYTPLGIGTYYANVAVTDAHPLTSNSLTSTLNVININSVICNGGVPTNVLPASLFQNYNTSRLTIYSDSANDVTGYYGNTVHVMEIVNQTAYGLPYNASTTLTFASNYIGQYNFTTPTNFHCQWLVSSSSPSPGPSENVMNIESISVPPTSVSTYSNIAFILFFIGLLLFFIGFFNIIGVINIGKQQGFIAGLVQFLVCFMAVIFLVWSGQYTGGISSPKFVVSSSSNSVPNTIINAASAISQPLFSITLVAMLIIFLSIISAIIGGLSFYLFMTDLQKSRKDRKMERANQ